MSRYSVAERSSIAGTSLRGQFSLYSPAGSGGAVRQVGLFNTTATAFAAALARFTATGTQGAGLTEAEYDENAPPPLMTAFAGHTLDATVGQRFAQISLGAAIGSGVIWTFGERGLVIAPGTGNGVGPIIPTGTGQISDFEMHWDE